MVRLAGVSVEQAADSGSSIERILAREIPRRDRSRSGRAPARPNWRPTRWGSELTDVYCSLKPRESVDSEPEHQQELAGAMSSELADLPGMNRVFTQPIEMRINELVAGIRADVGIKLFGDDLQILETKAAEIARLAESIQGASMSPVEQLTGQPEFRIEVDRQRISRYDLPAREVLNVVESMGGIRVGEVYEGQQRFDLEIRMSPELRLACRKISNGCRFEPTSAPD